MLLRVMVNTASSSPIIFGTMFPPRSGLVLFVADLFHPIGGLAIETFLNGDVRHGRGWRANVSHPARTRSRHPAECPRSDHPSVGPGRGQPSRSGSGPGGGCARLSER